MKANWGAVFFIVALFAGAMFLILLVAGLI